MATAAAALARRASREKDLPVRKLIAFNQVSLDGYFTDANADMSWAHRADPEWSAFAAENAQRSGGTLLFGRVTYELMASFWPTPQAKESAPLVAEGMNARPKVVFSRTLSEATWSNTKLVKTDPVEEVRALRLGTGAPMAIMGSGTIIAQLAQADLIDEYQIVVIPIVLGKGRTLFEGIERRLTLKLVKTRPFSNGNVVLWYEPA